VSAEPHIGTLNEGSLHIAMKERYARPGDAFEVPVDGFVVDIVRGEGMPNELFIEIQTSSFGSMGSKLDRLLAEHRMLLVHPIAVRTTLERRDSARRRSPKRGSIYSLFDELVSIPTLLDHPNLELDVVLADVTKLQEPDPKARRGRGGWRTVDRHLDQVLEVHRFTEVTDLLQLLPTELPSPFTTADIARGASVHRDVAQKLAYCFRNAGLIDEVSRTRAGIEYRLSD
jgi:hypothetical protein